MRHRNLCAHPALSRSGERAGPSSRHPGVRCPLLSALSHLEIPPGSVSRPLAVELRIPSRPEGSPSSPSAGAGSSLIWQRGRTRRARTCRVSAASQRRSRCHFPTASLPIHRFSFCSSPFSPSVNATTEPGEDRERPKSLGHPFLHGMILMAPHSCHTLPHSQPLQASFPPPSSGFWHPPCPDRWRRGTAGGSTLAGLPGARSFLPTALSPHRGHRHPQEPAGTAGVPSRPGLLGTPPAPARSLPDAVFSSLFLSLSRCRRGRPGREGRMVVLSLVLGLSEQDDFGNIPDLQPAGTQPNQANAQGDKRYERGRGQSRRRRRPGPHPGWRRRRRRRLASWSAKVGAAQGGPAGTGTSELSPAPAPAVLPPEQRHREDPHPFLLPPPSFLPLLPFPALAACGGCGGDTLGDGGTRGTPPERCRMG